MADKAFTESGISDFNKDLEANIKRLERLSKAADNASGSIDNLEASYNRLASLAEEPINFKIRGARGTASSRGASTSGRSSNTGNKGSKGGKSKNDLFFTITRLSDTATSAIKPVSSLASNITKLGIATGGTIAALTLLAKITVEAQKNTSNYARSMTVMNKELSLLDKRSLDTTNKINTLNNRMSNLMQGLGNLLSPVLDFVVDLAEVATSFLPSGEREDIIGTTKAGISSTSHQSGMTWRTTDTLADNTYNIALGLSSKYAEQASVIADKLAKAWMTGSDAAKEYGVVLNDNVLTGYLWNKGIDIANVEITDAMKQYYRYQLMVDQTSGKVTDSMIKDWTSLGFMIDKTKGKLFSFDEVIQLVAADPTIPDLVGDNTDINNSEGSRGIPPAIFNPDTVDIINTYGDGSGLNIPVNVPVTVPGGDLLEEASVLLEDIDPTYPANVAINIPLLPKLVTTKELVDYVDNKFDAEIDIKVVGLDILNNVKSLLHEIQELILSLPGTKINIPSTNTSSKAINHNTINGVITGIPSVNANKSSTNTSSKAINHNTINGVISSTPSIESQYDKDTLDTARKIATKNNSNFDKVNITDKQYYAIIAKEVNKNPILTIKDGVDMFNSYKSTGKVETWWNSKAADNLGTGMAVAAGILGTAGLTMTGIGLSGAAGIAGAAIPSAASTAALPSAASTAALPSAASTLALPAASSSSSTVVTIADWVSALAGVGFADGGIGTHEIHNATLFEGNKKEAVIPLETSEGIDYLATAMNRAGAGNSNSSGDIVINLTLSGLNLANNDAEWERVGRKIGEIIDIQRQRRGELNYGSSF